MEDLFDEKILKIYNYKKDIYFSLLNNYERQGIEIFYYHYKNMKSSHFNYFSNKSFEEIIEYVKKNIIF